LRPNWCLAVACLLVFASQAAPVSAAPPLFPRMNREGGSPRLPDSRAPRIPAKPLGVDAPAEVRSTSGAHYRVVVILLQFTDWSADTVNHTTAAFQNLLFSQGTNPTGSFRDYYNEVSRGRFDVDGVVTRWYTAPRTYAEYVNGQSGFGVAPFNAQQMALDALRLADPDIDYSQFDNDGPDGIPDSGDDDGQIDGLIIVHAGPGWEETGSGNDMRSHKWSIPGGAAAVDGVLANFYCTGAERWQGISPLTPPGSLMSIGVFCHEYGHVLGLPDLYDTSGLTGSNEGLGEWDLMASGLFNHLPGKPPGSCPAHLSAWSKQRLGWLDPTWVFNDSTNVTVPPVESTGQAFRLWTNGVEYGEYFLVENRQPVGFDAALLRSTLEGDTSAHAHGLMIYHVDETIPDNNVAAHKKVDVEEGGGIEAATGFTGVQNLDLERGSGASQAACEGLVFVAGNRGDRFDPWPGLGNRTSFSSAGCPNSDSYCGGTSQVSIENIAESGTGPVRDVTADFFVSGTTVRRDGVAVDDLPFDGNGNNGNGLVEPGETVRIHFPLRNLDVTPTGELSAKVAVTEPFAGLLADSIYYGIIPGAGVDSGTVIYAAINPTPDPRGVNLRLTVSDAAGLVLADSVQILVGQRTGLCDDFETTLRRWDSVPQGCGGVSEWHREAGANHTPSGSWAWRLGPAGPIGHYAPSEEARLTSQPIRLAGTGDTLTYWQRYDTEFAFDGLSIELSTDNGATWNLLNPIGGYNTGEKFSGTQAAWTQVRVPLPAGVGPVRIAFRFHSEPPSEGLGWWIDDVSVTGNAPCATTSVAIGRFDAVGASDDTGPAVRLDWNVSNAASVVVGIDRTGPGEPRHRVATLPAQDGPYLDRGVTPGSYEYWLVASRPGDASAEAGPVPVLVTTAPPVPRALSLSPVRPNPFRAGASFSAYLDREGAFVVRVFSADGRLVRTLQRGESRPAEVRLQWDGKDDRGRPAGAGIYFFELRSAGRARVQRAVLLR
jgi:immune inhibitor A